MYIGIDQSKRSTAAVCVGESGELLDFMLVCPPKEVDNEPLAHMIYKDLYDFITKNSWEVELKEIGLEGLSFGSVGSSKDLLAGIFWYVRIRIYHDMSFKKVKIVPVLSWRAKVIPIEERRLLKGMKSSAIKDATVAKLPFEVKIRFEDYIRVNSFKKDSLRDLADAYFISLFVGGFLDTK